MVFTIPIALYEDNSYNSLRRGYLLLIAKLIDNYLISGTSEEYKNDIIEIEKSCYNHALEISKIELIIPNFDNIVFENLYKSKIMKITKNMDPLSEINDDYLITKIINKEINLQKISYMRNEELSPKHNDILLKRLESRKNQKLTYKISSFYRCKKCNVPNTIVIKEMQLRSLDEASSISCYCHPELKGCGYKWIIN